MKKYIYYILYINKDVSRYILEKQFFIYCIYVNMELKKKLL